MLDKEFNLSEKIATHTFAGEDGIMKYIETKDVREFIKLLKEHYKWEFPMTFENINKEIDKLAGIKLTGKPLDLSGSTGRS